MAHRRVGHRRGGLRQQSAVLAHQRVVQHLVVGGHGPDREVGSLVAHAAQRVHPAHVYQDLRVGQPQPQQRDQRLTPGEDLRVVAVLTQRSNGLLDAAGADVVERRGDHRAPPPSEDPVCWPP